MRVFTWCNSDKNLGSIDTNECIHMRNSFIAVAVAPCEWTFRTVKFWASVHLNNGLYPPTDSDSESDSKPDAYIELCRSFSTGSDLELDPCTECFTNSYCTHFRDGSPSLFHTLESGDQSPNLNQWKNLYSTGIQIQVRIRVRLCWWKMSHNTEPQTQFRKR